MRVLGSRGFAHLPHFGSSFRITILCLFINLNCLHVKFGPRRRAQSPQAYSPLVFPHLHPRHPVRDAFFCNVITNTCHAFHRTIVATLVNCFGGSLSAVDGKRVHALNIKLFPVHPILLDIFNYREMLCMRMIVMGSRSSSLSSTEIRWTVFNNR